MPPRNHRDWIKTPKVEYINSLIYSDHYLYEQELENIFSKVWVPMCHSSEMPNLGDFRKTQIALKNVVAIRFEDNKVRTFLTDSVKSPAGNNLALTYHSGKWTELPCEVKHGGMIWTTLDINNPKTVDEWTAGAFDCIADAIDAEEMEVFHYHKAVIDTNYKLWHDTNSEFYHDFMHYFNRVSGFNDEYFARKNIPFDNGHVNVSSFTVNYEEYDGFED